MQDGADTTMGPDASINLFLNSEAIDGTLGQLCGLFSERTGVAEREMVSFCLRHIFYYTNQLYALLLPELTTYVMGDTGREAEPSIRRTMPMRGLPRKHMAIQYHIWSLLQEIEVILDRLELLSQLIISAITTMLHELDRTCSIADSIQVSRTQRGEGPYEQQAYGHSSKGQVNKNDHGHIHAEWQHGLAQAIGKMDRWLKNNQNRLSFASQFALLKPMIPTLTQIDPAFDNLLKSVYAIFGNILPAIHENGLYGDERAIMLFLDIIQRCDQIVLQIGNLAQPLHVLMDQYTFETTLQ